MTSDLPSPDQSLARPLYRLAEVRAVERAAAAGLPAGTLMERAGKAAAALALELLRAQGAPAAARAFVLVLAGPGNNGGDALEAAAHLAHAGCRVTVLHATPGAAVSAERTAALARAQASTARFIDRSEPAHADAGIHEAAHWQLIIDGLFGIGLARPITGALRQVVARVNALAGRCPVLALDVPSGLDADTGAVAGPDGIAIMASHTLTFIADKPGLYTNAGRDYAGHVTVAQLDIDPALLPPAQLRLNAPGLFAACLHPRRHASHKGSYGSVAVIGGASGMTGAPLLAARAALHSGAGRVYVLFPDAPLAADPGQPELMCRSADGYDLEQATLVIGPGLGAASSACALLAQALASGSALVADADALNLLAAQEALRAALVHRAAHGMAEGEGAVPAVLTPHPLEAARLLGVGVAQVQADRIAAARALAAQYQAVVVLKGSGTVIAAPDGRCVINPTGNPALATAGTGDVLAGLCGSLLAQGCPPWQAALAAVWLHGAAADALVAGGIGPIGVTAGELVPAIRAGLNALVRDQSRLPPWQATAC